ncbi:MAG: hypothetical protein HY282_13455 [Nitrospirae bacterium]|nr:hypothetical protein [Candidatus Manganitrophaceae bacterium]
MKKLWVVALASLGLLQTASLYAAADIKFEGDFRVRGIYADNLTDANKDTPDEQAFADGRFRLKTTATAGIVSGIVTLDFTSSFIDPGTNAGLGCNVTGCTTGNYRFGSANLGGSYNIVGVREAYLKLDLNMVKLAFGRGQIKLGHSLILDDTADGILAKFGAGPVNIMLADAKLRESNAVGPSTTGVGTGGDTDLYIAKFGFAHEEMHNLGLFVTYLNDRGPSFIAASTTPDKTDLWTAGVTADARLGIVSLSGEFDYLTGSQDNLSGTTPGSTDLKGWNVLLDAGLKVAMFDVDITGLYTTGDKSATDNKTNINGISGDFVLANILVNDNVNSDREGQCASIGGARIGSGGASCVGGLGIRAIRVGAGFELGMLGKGSHTEVAAIWAQTGERPAAVAGVSAKKDLGIEIDLNHRQKLDENVSVGVNLGYLFAGDFWKTAGATAAGEGPADNIVKGIVSLNYMF